MNDRVSIAIPSYNHDKYIDRAVKSCLRQTRRAHEILIIDDCSTDETLKRARSFEEEGVRVLSNSRNLGLCGNWNRCIEESRGDYLLILHSDDWLAEDAIETLIYVARHEPDAGLVILGGEKSNNESGFLATPDQSFIFFPKGYESFKFFLSRSAYCSSLAVRREVYEKEGLFDRAYEYFPDEEMKFRVAKKYAVANCVYPKVGVRKDGWHTYLKTWLRDEFWKDWVDLHKERLVSYLNEIAGLNLAQEQELLRLIQKRLEVTATYIARELIRRGYVRSGRLYLQQLADLKQYKSSKDRLLLLTSYVPNRWMVEKILDSRLVIERRGD
jgi:glycosyltransferase involved in cell wall biosynthesis